MEYREIVDKIIKADKNSEIVFFCDDDWDGAATFYFVKMEGIAKIHCQDDEGYEVVITPTNCENVHKVAYYKKGYKEKVKQIADDKKPTGLSKHVGVEIEFASKLNASDLKNLIAGSNLEKHVTLKDDGSLDDHEDFVYTHELCILGTEKSISKLIKKVCEILSYHSEVNDSCGLHVHLDMRSRDPDKAYANLFANQPLLYGMCPSERYESEFCYPQKQYVKFSNTNLEGTDRHRGINKLAYSKHKTIEIRMHSGTLDAEKIINWVKLLIKVADAPIRNLGNVEFIMDYSLIKRKLKLTGKLEKYVNSRIIKFKEGHEDHDLKVG